MNLLQLESFMWKDNQVYQTIKEAIEKNRRHVHFDGTKLTTDVEVFPERYVFKVVHNDAVSETLRFYTETRRANVRHQDQNLKNISDAITNLL